MSPLQSLAPPPRRSARLQAKAAKAEREHQEAAAPSIQSSKTTNKVELPITLDQRRRPKQLQSSQPTIFIPKRAQRRKDPQKLTTVPNWNTSGPGQRTRSKQQDRPTHPSEVKADVSVKDQLWSKSKQENTSVLLKTLNQPPDPRQPTPQARRSLDPDRWFYITPILASSTQGTNDMETSSASTAQSNTGASTAKPLKLPKLKLTLPHLAAHYIWVTPTSDPKLLEIKSIFKTSPPQVLKPQADVYKAAKDYIVSVDSSSFQGVDYGPLLNTLSFHIDRSKSLEQYPIALKEYFDLMLRHCRENNEAVLQRTIMMSVFHPCWVDEVIAWNAEGQWKIEDWCKLPSDIHGILPAPKCDLYFCFKRSAFTGPKTLDTPPPRLQKCFSPDGFERSFPFLFLEVKRSGDNTRPAEVVNLNTSSRALNNIYQWMSRSSLNDEKSFFSDVRVFSIVFNAQSLNLRVHRAEWVEAKKEIGYFFDDIHLQVPMEKDVLWLAVNSIIRGYAIEKLYPLLKRAFKSVCSRAAHISREIEVKIKASTAAAPKGAKSVSTSSEQDVQADPNNGENLSAEENEDLPLNESTPPRSRTKRRQGNNQGQNKRARNSADGSTGASQTMQQTYLGARNGD